MKFKLMINQQIMMVVSINRKKYDCLYWEFYENK